MTDRSVRRSGALLRRRCIPYAVVALAVSVPAASMAAGAADPGDRRAACQERFTGGPGDDTIHGNASDNVICGWGGHDLLTGERGRDLIRGGSGSDSLDGNHGRDALYGGAGNDRFDGGARADRVFGGTGDDIIRGATGDDVLKGGAGNDNIWGKDGDDVVHGGPGDDVIDLQHRDRFDTKDSATCGDGTDIVYIDAGGDGHGGRDTVDADCETVIED